MTAARILVAGDANLDLVLRGDVVPRFGQAEQLLDSADLVLGSSAGICASGLARLGVQVALCARVGQDLFGDRTRRLLSDSGVEVDDVVHGDGPTGLSVILSGDDDRSILTLTGAMAEVDGDDVRRALARLGATHLHVSSFFLMPKLAAALPALLAEARAGGITTSLDTNWDPAKRWEGVAECLPHLDLLLPNTAEVVALAAACGLRTADPLAAARALAELGPTVVVKDGAAGGFAVSATESVRAPGLTLDVVDTTGAGDSFDAGFLAAWVSGLPLVECVRWAAAAGSLSTRAAGGTGAQATRAELEDALR
jgi:sugar/nucleoside kinase (ribokinase family)